MLSSVPFVNPAPTPGSVEDPKSLLRQSFASAMRDPERLGREFYARLFELAPSIRPLFSADLQTHQEALVRALVALVRGLDDPDALVPSLRQLGARHVGYGVDASHYVVVGEALINTIARLSDQQLDEATRIAWTQLYGWIAATMLDGAASISAPNPPGGSASNQTPSS